MSAFPYRALDAAKAEIRLLTLRAGSWDDNIKCKLAHVSLHSNPDYEALSYTWGELEGLICILVDGHICEVRPNLEIALRHLRLEDKDRVLWIDALCINQDDISERNAQVPRMSDIYRKARSVLAWLGQAGDDGEEGMELMEEFGSLLLEWFEIREVSMPQITFTWMRQNGFDVSLKNWNALFNLWSRPYWNRIWVIQELAASIIASPLILKGASLKVSQRTNRCLIGCGKKWISSRLYTGIGIYLSTPGAVMDSLFNFTLRYEENTWKGVKRETIRDLPPALHIYKTLQRTEIEFHSKGCNALGKMLSITSKFDASDPRDKVYGLLALSLERDDIVPDYSESNTAEKILKGLVQDLIRSTQNLDILLGNRRRHHSNLPTWVPELSGITPRSELWFRGDLYNAGRIDGQTAFMDVIFTESQDLLRIRGTRIGRISRVMGPFPPNHLERRSPKSWVSRDSGDLTTIQSMFGYLSELLEFGKGLDASRREECWRTLLLNVNDIGLDLFKPPPDHFGMLFEIMVGLREIPPQLQGVEGAGQLSMILRPFYAQMEDNLAERCFFTTEDGHMALGPYHTKPGDVVAVLFGGSLCFVLRPSGENFELIGDAYVHGFMAGQALIASLQGEREHELFSLR